MLNLQLDVLELFVEAQYYGPPNETKRFLQETKKHQSSLIQRRYRDGMQRLLHKLWKMRTAPPKWNPGKCVKPPAQFEHRIREVERKRT